MVLTVSNTASYECLWVRRTTNNGYQTSNDTFLCTFVVSSRSVSLAVIQPPQGFI